MLVSMLRTLSLVAPALFPSWRFFQAVEPSPRIEAAFLADPGDAPEWRPVRPPPRRATLAATLASLFWNPRRNETLYLVSCAERIIEDGRAHAEREILARIRADAPEADGLWLRFRLRTVRREGAALVQETAHLSPLDPPRR